MSDSIAKKQCSKASGGGKKSVGTVHKTYAIVASSTPLKNSHFCAAAAPAIALVKTSPSSIAGAKKAAAPVKKSPSAATASHERKRRPYPLLLLVPRKLLLL
jgi:hypothetical protein